MKKFLRIGSRGSDLALWQAHYLQAQLAAHGVDSDITIIQTKGDKIQDLSFDKIEGKGFFTKEIEDALLRDEVDVAVHSMKDMPTTQPDGLVLTAVSYREDPADCLLISKASYDATCDLKLVNGAIVGTSSSRRKAQLAHLNPNIHTKDIRGNVPTRIEKLRRGDFDAIVLAKAGLNRLGLDLSDLQVVPLHPREFVPAPAQGVLAYQTHKDNIETRRVMKLIHNTEVAQTVNVERKVLKMLNGGCQMPVGVYCEKDSKGYYHAFASLGNVQDGTIKQASLSQSTTSELAEKLFQLLTNS